nr:MAG TPA: Endolysin [Bacteriophage sp.]
MDIRKNLLPNSLKSWKFPYDMKPEFIVLHNTANDASADNEVKYMHKSKVQGGKQVSYHYAVDDKEVVQALEENVNGWHAGDGAKGKGNRKGIAIEICYSKSGGDRFIKAEENAVELIVDILKRYGWGIDKVKKHQDFMNKYCPHRTLDMGWQRFLNMVSAKLGTPAKEEKKEEAKPTTSKNNFLPARGYFKKGDVSPNVGKIASFMRKVFPSYTSSKALGSTYGPYLISAVKEFQKRTGLTSDGYFGPLTLAKLCEFGFKY